MSIRVKDLYKSYGSERALRGVSMEVDEGQIVGLLGPNGAGKSTLMKTICGVLDIEKGSVEVDGIEVSADELKTKEKIGYLAEHNPLYKDMYVKEYLWFVSQLRKVKKNRIIEVVEEVGLLPNIHKKVSALSKGYKQRLGLAQAILNNPSILILDEPTNGLDPSQIIEIRSLIKKLSKNKTILLSTHILPEVEILCDRVILLNKGEIVADTDITDFKGQFKTLEEAFLSLTL